MIDISSRDQAANDAGGADQRPIGHVVAADQRSNNQSEVWWKQPEHIIQIAILLFVGAYTVLTFCLLWTS